MKTLKFSPTFATTSGLGQANVTTQRQSHTTQTMNRFTFTTMLTFLVSTAMGQAGPLDDWTWRNGGSLYGVAYGNGQFVAVGQAGAVVSSSDGVSWTQRRRPTTADLYGIAYGNGQFVAVGGGTIVTSADGVTWVQRQLGTGYGLVSIASGAGQFVAVGGGTTMTSTNGVNWVERKSGPATVVSSITYGGNGQFAAAGSNGAILTSVDGLNWVQQNSGTTNSLNGIAYGNGRFVAVGTYNYIDGSTSVFTSADGEVWSEHRLSSALAVGYGIIAFGNGQFVTVGQNSAATSADGVTWDQRTSGAVYGLSAIAYGNGHFVGVAAMAAIVESTDAANWVEVGPEPGSDVQSIAFGAGQFAAVMKNAVLTSKDGAAWVKRQFQGDGARSGIAYGNKQFVAVGYEGYDMVSYISTSADAINWAGQWGASDATWGVTFGNGQFVAVGIGGVQVSSDGTNWVREQLPVQIGLLGAVTYGQGQFIAVGGSNVVTSTDGTNWVRRDAGTTNSPTGIAYGNGQFVAVGGDGYWGRDGAVWVDVIVTSTDGVTWSQQKSGGGYPLNGIGYGNGYFVAVGDYGTVLVSHDGMHWDQRDQAGMGSLNAVTYGNGHFVAAGSGVILQSGYVISLTPALDPSTTSLSLVLEGPTGLGYTIQSSTDLISWQTVTNISSVQSITVIPHALSGTSDHAFYRARSQ